MFSIGFYFNYASVFCLEKLFWHIFLEVVIVYICLWFGPLIVSMLEQNQLSGLFIQTSFVTI